MVMGGSRLDWPVFDHHVHLDDPGLVGARAPAQSLCDAVAHGLVGAVSAGYGPEREVAARGLIQPDRPLWRAVGLHPWWLADAASDALRDEAVAALAGSVATPGVVAVGEIGLDATVSRRLGIDAQRRYLQAGLALARARDLPVILHVVRWHGHALDALRRQPPAAGVIHRFGGPIELVPAFLRCNLALSMAPDALRRPERYAALARAVPSDRLLVETDWPLDQRSWPAALAELRALVAAVAGWRGEDPARLAERLVANARALYRLGGP